MVTDKRKKCKCKSYRWHLFILAEKKMAKIKKSSLKKSIGNFICKGTTVSSQDLSGTMQQPTDGHGRRKQWFPNAGPEMSAGLYALENIMNKIS